MDLNSMQQKQLNSPGFGRDLFTTEGHETIKELRHEADDLEDDKPSPASQDAIEKLKMENGFQIEKQSDSKQGMFDIRERDGEEINTPKGMESQLPGSISAQRSLQTQQQFDYTQ